MDCSPRRPGWVRCSRCSCSGSTPGAGWSRCRSRSRSAPSPSPRRRCAGGRRGRWSGRRSPRARRSTRGTRSSSRRAGGEGAARPGRGARARRELAHRARAARRAAPLALGRARPGWRLRAAGERGLSIRGGTGTVELAQHSEARLAREGDGDQVSVFGGRAKVERGGAALTLGENEAARVDRTGALTSSPLGRARLRLPSRNAKIFFQGRRPGRAPVGLVRAERLHPRARARPRLLPPVMPPRPGGSEFLFTGTPGRRLLVAARRRRGQAGERGAQLRAPRADGAGARLARGRRARRPLRPPARSRSRGRR